LPIYGPGESEVSAECGSRNHRLSRRWLRTKGHVLRLPVCFFFILLATVFVGFLRRNGSGGELIWPANGMLLAYLLLAPRWRWPGYLLSGFLAMELGGVLLHEPWRMGLLLNLLHMAEVLIAARLLRRRSAALPRFADPVYLERFLGFAVLSAPVLTASLYAWMAGFWLPIPPLDAFLNWAIADCLGLAIFTPIFVAIFQTNFRKPRLWRQDWMYLALTAVAALAAFSQDTVPLVFLMYPILVVVALHVDLGQAAVALLEIAATACWYTGHGEGPLAAIGINHHSNPFLHLQLLVAAGVFILYGISVVIERQKMTERRLRQMASLHQLVTENSRDVIIIADFHGKRSYVSASGEGLCGWNREEMLHHHSLEMVHPQDLPKVEAMLRDLHSSVDDGLIELRIRKKNGDYVWVEAALRVVRDPETGARSGILNTVRDISERKRAEIQLQEAYRAVEMLALTDGLTGLANRRRFDQYLGCEWRRALRERQPLTLLMIDADLFKFYNDTYGHMRGDSCLKQIAEACQDVLARPGDMVARFGGEEFIAILPNTTIEGGCQVANEICEAVRHRGLPHRSNPAGIVTISIGCATATPQFGLHAFNLIELADKALYRAKQNGRNQAYCGNNRSDYGEEEEIFNLSAKAARTG
ncbi:MAG: diguanylate cyclase, partial [Terracidiphilus sp.]